EQVIKGYSEKNIPTMIYYRTCMHQQTAFKYLDYNEGDFPIAEKLSKEVFSLPMHGYLEL
uniref:DegT/DnrJ/EryC1/StrS family aminotransferase n=1 Tax=Photobacterium leiognathi TaxID=553611 RepID=UPI002980B6EC